MYDVAIIGASVAGATAAHILGRAGFSVALIDKETFPRRKPCGEGLAGPGIHILERLDLASVLTTTPHLPFCGYRLMSRGRSTHLSTPESGGITLQRYHFDAALLTAALAHPTVTPYLNQRVSSVTSSGHITLKNTSLSAHIIILSAGANSSLTRMLGLHHPNLGRQRMGISATFQGNFPTTPDRVHITVTPDYEIYATPLPDHQLNISLLAKFPTHLNLRHVLLSPEVFHAATRPFDFTGELTLAPLGRAPIGHVSPQSYKNQVILIGDAAEEFDPIGGMGMTHALRSAELACNAIIDVLSEKTSSADAWSNYHKNRIRLAKKMRSFTALCYYALRSAATMPRLIDLAGSPLGHSVSSYFSSLEGVL